MFQGENTIQIKQVANAWMVVLPYQPFRSLGGPDIESFRLQARAMKEEFVKDPELDGIEGYASNVSPKIRQRELTPIVEMKEENIFMFQTFSEVLAFLKVKVDS